MRSLPSSVHSLDIATRDRVVCQNAECLVKDVLENGFGWASSPRGLKSLAFGSIIKRLLAKVSKNSSKAKLADGWEVIIREWTDLRAGIVELDESMFTSTVNRELRDPASKDRRVRCRYLPSMQERCREPLRSQELRYG